MIDSLAKIFEACIAMVTAVMGLAYPMFVERVKGFDDKYGARVISEKFENEILYKALITLLYICVIELFVIPFILLACGSHLLNILLITIQAICVFALCIDMIGTFELMKVYSDPARYLNRVKEKESPENIFQILQILIVQGAKNKTNDDLYNDATREFCERLLIFQQNRVTEWNESNDKDKSVADDFFIYPSPIFQALLQIGFRSADPEMLSLTNAQTLSGFYIILQAIFP